MKMPIKSSYYFKTEFIFCDSTMYYNKALLQLLIMHTWLYRPYTFPQAHGVFQRASPPVPLKSLSKCPLHTSYWSSHCPAVHWIPWPYGTFPPFPKGNPLKSWTSHWKPANTHKHVWTCFIIPQPLHQSWTLF